MHVFPATFADFRPRIGSRRITFEIDDIHKELSEKIGNSSIGTHFLLVAYEIGEEAKAIQEAHVDPAAAKNKLIKRLHATVGEYAELTGVGEDIIKNVLRLRLRHHGLIEKSMSELDEASGARAVYVLNTEMHPQRFNYEQYKN